MQQSKAQRCLLLHGDFEANLGYMKPCCKTTRSKTFQARPSHCNSSDQAFSLLPCLGPTFSQSPSCRHLFSPLHIFRIPPQILFFRHLPFLPSPLCCWVSNAPFFYDNKMALADSVLAASSAPCLGMYCFNCYFLFL